MLEGWLLALLPRVSRLGPAPCPAPAAPLPRLQGCSTLTDEGLAHLGKGGLRALAALNLSECGGITGAGAVGWRLPALTALQLQNCPGVDDAGVAALAGLTALRSLNLKQCKRVSDAGLAALAPALQQLTALALQGAGELTDGGVAALAQMRSLADLELQFSWQFGDAGVAALTALTALSRLDLIYRRARMRGGRRGGGRRLWAAPRCLLGPPDACPSSGCTPARRCSWKVTDASLEALARMTSLLELNVLGCHRLSPQAKAAVAHLLDSAHAF